MRRSALRLAALAATALALPAAASAQSRYGRVVAFGDSYADSGNLFRLIGQPFPSVYPTGRFSGGTNFVDTLSGYYGVPQVNYAIGGAQTGATNVTAGAPGFVQQYTNAINTPVYQSFGTAQSFQPTDLVAVSIGGNDARAYRLGGGTMAGVGAAAAVSIAQANTGLNALVARGARTIVFLGGDVGLLPEAIGQANAAIGSAFSQTFNAGVRTTLAGYAANGVTVAYVDTTAIANQVRAAGLARYGFIDITNVCGGSAAAAAACVGSPAIQAQYLFYVDGVHLTSAGFDVIGRYAINQLAAPYSFRQSIDIAQRGAQAFGQTLNSRLDLARGGTATPGSLALFGNFTALSGRRDADASADAYQVRGLGAVLGAEYRGQGFTAGVAGAYDRPRSNGGVSAETRIKSWRVGGFAGFDSGSLFAQGYASYSWDRAGISRTGVLDPLVSRPDGHTLGAGGRVGFLIPAGPVRIGPVAGVAYARTTLDGYTETGDLAAALIVSRQRTTALVGSLGAELRGSFDEGRIRPYLRATAEREFEGDARTITYANVNSANIVNRFAIARDERDVDPAVAGGVQAELAPGVAVDVDAKWRFANGGDRDGSVRAGLSVGF